MASNLFSKYPKVSCNLVTIMVRNLPLIYNNSRNKSLVKVDTLDDFTSRLIQNKIGKWETKKPKHKPFKKDPLCQVVPSDDQEVNLNALNSNIQCAIDCCNYSKIVDLIGQCVDQDKCPSASVMLSVLPMSAQNGDKNTLLLMKELCTKHESEFIRINANFQHYIAEAIWVKGDIIKSLDLFEEVYRNNAYVRRNVRLMMRHLFTELIPNRSEAALVKILGFCERLLREFKDVYLLTWVWQLCFLSEWYADNCTALELLEKYEMLREAAINRIPYVVAVSLRSHRTEVVYRLLEVLLKYEMKAQSATVLISLLDYQMRCYNFDSCTEIIRWAADNDIVLPNNQNMLVIIDLLLSEKRQAKVTTLEAKTGKMPKYDLKF